VHAAAALPFVFASAKTDSFFTSVASASESLQGDGVQITLTDLSYREVPCPPGFYLPEKGSWDCLEVSATASNNGKRAVSAAGVFGFIRDADGYPCLSTALDEKMRTSIASLGSVPKGRSKVSFTVAVSRDAPRPLTLQNFKASYSNKAIERQFEPFDRCELDPIACALEDDD